MTGRHRVIAGAYHGFDSPAGKVRVRSTTNTNGTRNVHVGRDPAAADESVRKTKAWLAAALKTAAAK
jgi:dienelactone hydrolase